MTKRLAMGPVPAIATLLTLFALAVPASAQVTSSAATQSGTVTAVSATPDAVTTNPVVSAPLPQVTSGPIVTLLQPAVPGRAAVLSSAPRATSGTTPPAGAADVRPAVTHAGLWPMVWTKMNSAAPTLNEQEECIAIAVYHEARGEPLDGQLAVAEVIMNRAASGRYPASWCQVVKQPWQFSFVHPRSGRIPAVNRGSTSWAYAQAITRIAVGNHADALPGDVLWYHADYVAPSWGRRLAKVEKIGAHIFYRAS